MSEERPNKCPNCEAPVVWCACIVKSCPICNTIPKVGGGMIVHPLCDCFDEKYIEFDAWQSRPIEDELRAEIARRDEIITRLKEDGERLAKVNLYDIEIYNQCPFCFTDLEYDNTVHQVDCPITIHRALMKELK
jgi:hypothetical protein